MLKKVLWFLGTSVVVLALSFAGFVWWQLQPHQELRPLPDDMVAISTADGQELLRRADAAEDYEPLAEHFTAQSLKSYCGVASSVAVLSALGEDVDQGSFFTAEASSVRPRMKVAMGGMSLPDLGGLLEAHGASVSVHHADTFTVEEFREVVANNLSDAGDFLIVNYQREELGQPRVGHISPLAAYDGDTDMVLVMDTASHYYPHTWVSLEKLYAAMRTTDSSSGRMRGYVTVTGLASPG